MTRPAILFGVVLTVAGATTLAQDYPVRPIRMIVAQSAGSALDTVVRIVTNKMSESLGQQFVIDNRGGAAGMIGVEIAARAAPDGYTLLAGASSSMIVSAFTYKKVSFDPIKDFDPISLIAVSHAIMAVHPSVAAKNVKEFIALAKAKPGQFNMSSAGMGSSSHLAGLMFTSMTGIETVHIPYKGGGPMATAVVAGEAHWLIAPAAALVVHIKAGRMRALAISTAERSPLLPDLPTIAESGVPGYDFTSWNGFFAPRGTPRPIIARLHGTLLKVLAEPDVRQQYAGQGLAPVTNPSPEDFGKFVRNDYERLSKLVKIAGIKPE